LPKLNLFDNEKVVGSFGPTAISFLSTYFPYLYLVGVGIFLLVEQDSIIGFVNYLGFLGPVVEPYLNLIIFVILIVFPAILLGLLQISLRIVVIFGFIAAAGVFLQIQGYPAVYRSSMVTVFGIVTIFLVEIHRRSHKYYVTNYRVITERNFPQYDRRETLLENIQDIAVQQGLLGRLFNFGNVIPTSGSGIGTGQDIAGVHLGMFGKVPKTPIVVGGAATGQKGVVGFRARPHNCFFGIRDPKKANDLIAKMRFERSETTKLGEIDNWLRGKR